MTVAAVMEETPVTTAAAPRPWLVTLQGAAALAAAMGVGRFVYTPILPLMHAQAGLSVRQGSALATANYVGYLLGALLGIVSPRAVRSRTTLRVALAAVTATLALMPATHAFAAWFILRLVAGTGSALAFVVAVNAVLGTLRARGRHLTGWAFGGIGVGIAVSGALVLALQGPDDWRQAWWLAAAASAVLSAAAWRLPMATEGTSAPADPSTAEPGKVLDIRFKGLLATYTLEGVGYIIAGTFLVAAIDQHSARWVGTSAWVLAGLAAVPSSAAWAWLSRTRSRPALLIVALLIQAAGVALPALVGGTAAALVSAAAFGATFVGISTLALAHGAHLRVPRAVAILTTGYGVGQIAGPLLVTPLLHHGYQQALLIAALILGGAAAIGALTDR